MAKSAEFNEALRKFSNENRDDFFQSSHASYLINMAIELHKHAAKRTYISTYNYCSSIFFSNIAYESIANVTFSLLETDHTIDKNLSRYPVPFVDLYTNLRKHKRTHKPKLNFCQYYMMAAHMSQKYSSTKTKHGLIPGTQLFKLLPYMDKLKELILYVNHWTLSSKNTPVWLGSFLSVDDLDALSTCLCGNLYFYTMWFNQRELEDESARNGRPYVSKTDDEVWDEFVDLIGVTHRPSMATHIGLIDEFVDDLITVIIALSSKSPPNADAAISSYERLTKRRPVSEGLGLDHYFRTRFLMANPGM